MRGLAKLKMMSNYICTTRSLKVYSSSYLQTSTFFTTPDKPHLEYHGAMEETKGEAQIMRKGDMINLNDLLFTKDRDYLVRSHDDKRVKAVHLADKLIVLFFMPLHRHCTSSSCDVIINLTNTYSVLLPYNCFEVVLVTYGTAEARPRIDSHTFTKKRFEYIFSSMSWTAIPYSDLTSRERLACIFGISPLADRTTVVIGSSGMILETDGCKFEKYGGLGYYTCLKYFTLRDNPNPHRKYHGAKEETKGELQIIRKGDMIDLHDLLFTKDRDYLVKYNDDRQVKAVHLAGKVIVLYFVPLHHDYSSSRRLTSFLIDTYTYLLPDNNFEAVLVAYGTAEDRLSSNTNFKKNFEAIFSCMPWTAIPFSDITSCECLASRFDIGSQSIHSSSIVISSSGIVLQTDGCDLFEKYGALGYCFSDKWIEYLEFQDAATAKKPSLKALLGSPKRDYVISNKGDKVLIDTLGEKVVALYFYEEGITPAWLTAYIKEAYEEFAQNKSCFEVVLVYLYDTNATVDRTSEESFRNTFETMPWLAVPFKDPKCLRLARFFGYPYDQLGLEESPRLVIFGPHGKYIEPWGSDIILKFKFPAYPFTRERVVKLYTEKLRELNLEMLWDQETIFRRGDESKVQFSQLVGKRIMLFFEGDEENQIRRKKVASFLSMLRKRYFDKKGTSDEFEVIYITTGKRESPYNRLIAEPWLVSLSSQLLPFDLSVHCCYCHLLLAPSLSSCSCSKRGKWPRESSILAFDQDGTVVRKSLELSFKATKFPFYAGSMEKETFFDLNEFYGWGKMDQYHWGLRINSYHKNVKLPYVYSYEAFLTVDNYF